MTHLEYIKWEIKGETLFIYRKMEEREDFLFYKVEKLGGDGIRVEQIAAERERGVSSISLHGNAFIEAFRVMHNFAAEKMS